MSAEQDRWMAAEKSGKKPEICSRVMLVRILGTDLGEPWGDIIHPNLQRPVLYHSLADLSFSIDRIARFLNLLGEQEKLRSSEIDSGEREMILPKEYQERIPAEQWLREGFYQEVKPRKIQKAVCVELIGGHYRSLQGRLWGEVTKGHYRYFRSVLELMYLFLEMQQKPYERGQQDEKGWKNRERQPGRKEQPSRDIRFREEIAAGEVSG